MCMESSLPYYIASNGCFTLSLSLSMCVCVCIFSEGEDNSAGNCNAHSISTYLVHQLFILAYCYSCLSVSVILSIYTSSVREEEEGVEVRADERVDFFYRAFMPLIR